MPRDQHRRRNGTGVNRVNKSVPFATPSIEGNDSVECRRMFRVLGTNAFEYS